MRFISAHLATFPGELARRKKELRESPWTAAGQLTHAVDLVEDWDAQAESDEVVAPDPLVLDVVFQGELGDLSREGVREFHRASDGFSCWHFSHFRVCFGIF